MDFPLTRIIGTTYTAAAKAGFGEKDVIGIIEYLNR